MYNRISGHEGLEDYVYIANADIQYHDTPPPSEFYHLQETRWWKDPPVGIYVPDYETAVYLSSEL